MKFRRETTYNTHDTQVYTEPDRTIIAHGMAKRCALVVRAVCRHPEGVDDSDLTEHLNKRLGSLYSVSDIRGALKKLVNEGLIERVGRTRYRAFSDTQALWAEAFRLKTMI